MLRSIGKQCGESVESVLKKKRKATAVPEKSHNEPIQSCSNPRAADISYRSLILVLRRFSKTARVTALLIS